MRKFWSLRHLSLLAVLCMIPAVSHAQVAVSIRIGPPALPVYEQPPCPVEGYMWTPGYWAYGPAGYYWVPGVWVAPPRVGVLWTPGYWGFVGGVYAWHAGYWGPHIGFYGGINYGFGYGGVGFVGGRWDGGHFLYNTAVVRVNTTVVRNVYVDRTVVHENVVNHASFNGPGGINARPTAEERTAMHEQHFQPTHEQVAHRTAAGQDHSNWASENHGQPSHPAMNRVNARETNQQNRIANGVRSGQMTPRETANTERREANINREVRQDRQANGGRLTNQERQQVNRQQNRASKQIYQDKHNDQKDRR